MANTKLDLLIVTDATASMGMYLTALREALPEVLALSKLSGVFDRIGVLAYRDYSEPKDQLIEWSGWNDQALQSFVFNLRPIGGGDYPEAAKTALNRVLELCTDGDRQTLILWYADAPPHSIESNEKNAKNERKTYPGDASDWAKLAYAACKKRCTIFSFVSLVGIEALFYIFLSEVSGGRCIIPDTNQISRLTVDVIIRWAELFDWTNSDRNPRAHANAVVHQYCAPLSAANPTPNTEIGGAHGYLSTDRNRVVSTRTEPLDLSTNIPVTPSARLLQGHSLTNRFSDPAENAYRATVYETLESLIESNVHALTYNPVFGQLWRVVCKDTQNEDKKALLLNAFSVQVSKTTGAAQKAVMQQWLDDSFDSTAEIERIIEKAPPETPRVYLDMRENGSKRRGAGREERARHDEMRKYTEEIVRVQ